MIARAGVTQSNSPAIARIRCGLLRNRAKEIFIAGATWLCSIQSQLLQKK
jgi:hypothetical protein